MAETSSASMPSISTSITEPIVVHVPDSNPNAVPALSASDETLVQYVVMRSDLIKQHRWNVGALIANGSHACISVIAAHWQDEAVQRYVTSGNKNGAPQMHKVVLSVKDENELTDTAQILSHHRIVHQIWTEQPEAIQACLAVKPYPRSIIAPLLKHLKLFR